MRSFSSAGFKLLPDGTVKKQSLRNLMAKKKAADQAMSAAGPANSRQKRHPAKGAHSNKLISSTLSYEGPLFRVYTDEIREDGKTLRRDVIRHNGSVVILAVDNPFERDPLIVVERQYRHAAKQILTELPAGTLERGEEPKKGAKRELLEETGYKARRWRKLVRFFASPGFLGEWMQVYLAEDLTPGSAKPEEDESIDVAMIRLSVLLRMIENGEIHDGKTMIALLLYERQREGSRKPAPAPRK